MQPSPRQPFIPGQALITGASSGIGIELAKQLAKEGVSLILTSRNIVELDKVASSLKTLNPSINIDTIAMDLGRTNAASELDRVLKAKGLRVDLLINNAGIGTGGSFSNLSLDKELQMIDLNIRSLVELTHLLLPRMLENRFGKILNVGSIAGFMPGPHMASYFASKAFVNSFSEALSVELKGTGVTCTMLTPGPTSTNFAKSAGVGESKLFKLMPTASAADVAEQG